MKLNKHFIAFAVLMMPSFAFAQQAGSPVTTYAEGMKVGNASAPIMATATTQTWPDYNGPYQAGSPVELWQDGHRVGTSKFPLFVNIGNMSTLMSDYVTKTYADATYLTQAQTDKLYEPIGGSGTDLSAYLKSADAANTYETITDASNKYLTITNAGNDYVTKTFLTQNYIDGPDSQNLFMQNYPNYSQNYLCFGGQSAAKCNYNSATLNENYPFTLLSYAYAFAQYNATVPPAAVVQNGTVLFNDRAYVSGAYEYDDYFAHIMTYTNSSNAYLYPTQVRSFNFCAGRDKATCEANIVMSLNQITGNLTIKGGITAKSVATAMTSGSTAHFLCIDDTGLIYKSDTSCK